MGNTLTPTEIEQIRQAVSHTECPDGWPCCKEGGLLARALVTIEGLRSELDMARKTICVLDEEIRRLKGIP